MSKTNNIATSWQRLQDRLRERGGQAMENYGTCPRCGATIVGKVTGPGLKQTKEWRESAALSLCQRAVDDLARCGYVTGSTVERMKKLLAAPAGEGAHFS